jgi:hypothetical protein
VRTILISSGGLLAALLLPLLLVAALLGALPSAAGGGLGAGPVGDLAEPAAFSYLSGGCTESDPTGGRCLTPATRHHYDEIIRIFGAPGPTAPIRSIGCWDAHAWNPSSDHPRGRACDYFPAAAGTFPRGQELANGWAPATWLRAHASALHVDYIIWQGRIWSPGDRDLSGWGRPYTGGGVYDASNATGGHYDHVHVSVAR